MQQLQGNCQTRRCDFSKSDKHDLARPGIGSVRRSPSSNWLTDMATPSRISSGSNPATAIDARYRHGLESHCETNDFTIRIIASQLDRTQRAIDKANISVYRLHSEQITERAACRRTSRRSLPAGMRCRPPGQSGIQMSHRPDSLVHGQA